ncbi:SH3 domain-containing protein [Caenorhabditis elegans]|uniref:SH3 domain-containing protein n=3 Tax=Caenorhabditis elegans TaxID=6239 RepID=U4PLS7_CAEEL|nr:SH3 domain-containing protein [Caenorhabditis elegans]CDH93039.1 SH3 domain-containing protein [Caenorhabditis elegans]|eukprot:NP_001294330.1 Uncharacterized protein CELE_F19C7.8 [Caenorhabditis elegans]
MEFKVSSSQRCSSPPWFLHHHLTTTAGGASRPLPLHHRSHSASTPTTTSSITASPSLSQLPPHQPYHLHQQQQHHQQLHKTMTSALEKCTSSLSEIHRLLRESSTSSYGTMSTNSSIESSPIEQATSRSARRKWHSAMRFIQGVQRFKTPVMSHKRTTEIREQSVGRTSCESAIVDPVYLALKQATGRYSRRGSTTFESASPSPRNLSQVSLQDSGYVEMGSSKANPLLGSTPQLDNAGRSVGRRRAPKLTQQMKSLSLDCQDMPPRINQNTRSPLISGSKLAPRDYRKPGINGSSDFSDVERSCSPIVKSRRSSSSALHAGGYIVIHEYSPSNGSSLVLGEKVRVVDNGDPDWLHGFRLNDRTEHMISFPATCVAQMMAGEQAMRIQQNVFVAEQKLRMYRDQIVFVQPESLVEGKVTVRTEHNALAPCPLSYLALI